MIEKRSGLVHRVVGTIAARIGNIIDSVDPVSDAKETSRTADDERLRVLTRWDQGNSIRDWTTVVGNMRKKLSMNRNDAVIKKLRDSI